MRSLRFVQFSDTHLFGDPERRLRGVATLASFRAAVEHAAGRFTFRDAVLLTGDLVQDDPGGYQHVRAVLGSSNVPVLCLAGNHDLPGPMAAALGSAPFQIGGGYDAGAWYVLLLETWIEHSASGRLGDAQLQALDAKLDELASRHVLLCLHHHPIPMQSRWLDAVGLEDMNRLTDLIRGHPNVRGVLWGHVHQALDTFSGGVRFMATPSTCIQFVPLRDDFAIDPRPPAYRVIELHDDGSIATEVVWAKQ